MSWIDYVMIAVIVLSALVGLARGVVREVLSLGIWIAAMVVAWLFHREVADLLTTQFAQPALRIAVAFAGLVFATLIVGALLGALLSALINKTGLTSVDHVLGFVFGAGRGVVMLAMAVFLAALTPLVDEVWWRESMLIGEFQQVANAIFSLMPADLQTWMARL